jgi:putative redox protein
MKTTAEVHWIQGIGFEVQVRDHHQFTDGKKEFGGKDRGPNPKEYVLAGLCGCSGMDVVSLLKKYKVTYESFEVSAEAEMTTVHPIIFSEIHLNFKILGPNVDNSLFQKAIELSMTKYCGVSAMLSKAVAIHYHIISNGVEFHKGIADFLKNITEGEIK